VTSTISPGIFDDATDVGPVAIPGSVQEQDGGYRVTGSGTNMWFERDEFHFVWKRVEGDIALAATIAFPEAGADPHRKACLVIRASLEPGAAYADIALHGDGLTSLQYRPTTGAVTREVQSSAVAPRRIGITRRGDVVTALVDGRPSGGSVRLRLDGAYYVGLAVCSHDPGVAEAAVFSDVELGAPTPSTGTLWSSLETVDIASTDRRAVHVVDRWIEAPNWTADDRLVFNGEGRIFAVAAAGGDEERIDTGTAVQCNNDHGLSPDGTQLAISDQSEGESAISILPLAGGVPQRVTTQAPSFWHGWSPDGAILAYTARRDGVWGVFTIPADGGEERRLTTATGLDDGPDYSPDGRWIYFNSDRTGRMQIHRIPAEGGDVERVLETATADWFPHISPDGRWLVHLAYAADVVGHPRDHEVTLQLVDLTDGSSRVLAELFGGQGTINVPSWSPDSRRLAFVSYEYH
jgi:hypothetical protein